MTKTYEDTVNRTFELYSSQIGEALTQLRQENPNFGRYEISPGNNVEAKFDDKNGVTGISFGDVKMLEERVRILTGDPTAKLMRNFEEYQKVRGIGSKVAKFEADQDKATLNCYDWLDENFRANH